MELKKQIETKQEIQRIVYKPKLKKFGLVGGICYIELRGSIYFLGSSKYESIGILRKVTNFIDKKPLEFYNIIHNNFLKVTEQNRQTEIKKKPYYSEMRIKGAELKIQNLKEKIKQEEINLNELKNLSNITTQQLKHKTESFK